MMNALLLNVANSFNALILGTSNKLVGGCD